jgi:hypothetical protein
LATRTSYWLCETPRAAEVITQPSSGWLSSIPRGLAEWSVVSEPTTGVAGLAVAACWDGWALAMVDPVSVNTARARENTPAAAARSRRLRGLLGGSARCDEGAWRRCLAIM